ncbi:hypothetical protein FI667_g17480, partial [Globisporangium splendens]
MVSARQATNTRAGMSSEDTRRVDEHHSLSLFRTNVAQPRHIFANGALYNTQDVVDEDEDDVFFSPMTRAGAAASESEGNRSQNTIVCL